MNLIPPVRLILDNRIGHRDNENIAKDFDAIGRRLVADMIKDGVLKPDYRVLDVGCGLGRLARVLTEYLSPAGFYQGIDATKSSVEWCQNNYTIFENFDFIHADVFSSQYNPRAKYVASNYRFPFENNRFDLIFSTSLFTHMRVDGVDNYLAEMRRIAKPGSMLWHTYFLLDEVTTPLVAKHDEKRLEIYMAIPVDGGRVAIEYNPEALCGQYTYRVSEMHIKNGLEVLDIQYGTWSGIRKDARAFYQDIVIARKN